MKNIVRGMAVKVSGFFGVFNEYYYRHEGLKRA